MRPKFQADADLHFEIVAGVLRREPAIDFQSAQEGLEEGADDQSVLAIAAAEDRILVSHDVSTMPREVALFLASRKTCPGVLMLPQAVSVGDAIEEIVLIWAASQHDEWRDRVNWLPL